MTRRYLLNLAAALALAPATAAMAADGVPPIKLSDGNRVPECVTPGRLNAYLRSRNDSLDPRFEKIAVAYMQHGERLGLRWDYTFYQMLLETGYLTYKGDRGRRGDVKPEQNNFAGLGATGRGEPGESFKDVSTGVLAHLQHVLVYSGEAVDNPVADRTRKVQEWGILKSMQQKARGGVTFAHLAKKWAPGADYVAGLESLASRFQEGFCNKPDPHPEWIAEARGAKAATKVAKAEGAETGETAERVSGADLARRAIEDGKSEGNDRRKGLGAGGLAKPKTPSFSLLNAPKAEAPAGEDKAASAEKADAESEPAERAEPRQAVAKEAATKGKSEKPAAFVQASAAGALSAAQPQPPAAATAAKCRVWTASYGGQKALIIRVKSDKSTDYTVLDVNEGAEKREAQAYIAAYAKGGEIEAEFASQQQALDKAFELCPEK